MYLRWITTALILSSSAAFALTDTLTSFPEHTARSSSTPSRIKRRCPLPTEDEPNPICHPPPPAQDPSVHSYTINDPNINKIPINVKITVPDTLSVETWNDTLLANLKTTLPATLKQLYVDPDQISTLAEEGLPYLFEAITTIQSGLSLPDVSSDLVRRGLFSKIGNWIKKVSTFLSHYSWNDVADGEMRLGCDCYRQGRRRNRSRYRMCNLRRSGLTRVHVFRPRVYHSEYPRPRGINHRRPGLLHQPFTRRCFARR